MHPWLLTHNAVKATVYLQPQTYAAVLLNMTGKRLLHLFLFFSSKHFSWQWSKREVQSQIKEEINYIKPNQRHERAFLRTDDKPTTSLPEPWMSRMIRDPPTPSLAVVGHLCPSSSETSQGDAPVERAQFPLMNGPTGRKDRCIPCKVERKIIEQMIRANTEWENGAIALRLHSIETMENIST